MNVPPRSFLLDVVSFFSIISSCLFFSFIFSYVLYFLELIWKFGCCMNAKKNEKKNKHSGSTLTFNAWFQLSQLWLESELNLVFNFSQNWISNSIKGKTHPYTKRQSLYKNNSYRSTNSNKKNREKWEDMYHKTNSLESIDF